MKLYKNRFEINKRVDKNYLGSGTSKDYYVIYDRKLDKFYSINKNHGLFATPTQAKRYIDLVLLSMDSTPHV